MVFVVLVSGSEEDEVYTVDSVYLEEVEAENRASEINSSGNAFAYYEEHEVL